MTSQMRSSDEIALTKEQYDALMEHRTRPIGEPCMSNRQAALWRAEQSAVASSPTDNVVDVVQRLVDARRARQKAS